MSALLEMRGISKRFPGVVANDHIDLTLQTGEVHAILGENGAGKSTLMKILYGLYHADEGQIYWKSQPIRLESPRDAIAHGIGMVHQDFKLVARLTVHENVSLGRRSTREPFRDSRAAIQRVKAVSREFGLPIDPLARIERLPAGLQQRVEIIKVLSQKPELIILDEPTSVLTPQEVESLFLTIGALVERGKSVCFVTHKLEEVMRIAGPVTVLRDGLVVGTVHTCQTSTKELARMMVGREVLFRLEKPPLEPQEPILKVEGVEALADDGRAALKGVSLEVRAGEILGVAGVSGNGQDELAEAIAGLRPVTAGRIRVNGTETTQRTPREVLGLGVAYIPDKVRQCAVFMGLDVEHNALLGSQRDRHLAPRGILSPRRIARYVNGLIREYGIRAPSRRALARQLSGGNLQRLVLAREFSRRPRLIVAANPTAGVDVGAIEYIHSQLLEQRQQQRAILLISADLDELLSLSDRIAVMYAGQIVGLVDAAAADLEEIGLMMGGSKAGVDAVAPIPGGNPGS